MATSVTFVEYTISGRPVGLIEARRGGELSRLQREALVRLAGALPAFLVFYEDDCTKFMVQPLNKPAEELLANFKDDKPGIYYRIANSVVMNVAGFKGLLQIIHGIKEVTWSNTDQKAAYEAHIVPVDRVADEIVDIGAVLDSMCEVAVKS
jgi:hypothetical protein